jgi:aconitate hydratase
MPRNVVEKILAEHMAEGKPEVGAPVTIRMDQTLTQDATGTMTYLQLEVLDPRDLATELSVSYVDHNTTQIGFENFDDHRYLQSVARKYGIHFSRAGNGICHQVHLERFAVPGRTLLGSDSHTPTAGGMGMFAVGAGGLDVALAMARGTFIFAYPSLARIRLSGRLPPWVSAKDVILRILQMLTTKGNAGTVIEYGGPALQSLTVPERATIANMGAELGVITSVFPADQVTRDFLSAQGRGHQWKPLEADPGAGYDREIELDLASIEPMVAQPHSPDNVATVREIQGLPVDQVAIGSCTNSSYKDLVTAAAMLEGRTCHRDVSFVVAPGSRQVLRLIADSGALSTLIAAGARLAECACGFCIGNSHAPGTDTVSVRTSNRNFQGRSGTESARVYLTGVETAVAAALTGRLADPRDLGIPHPQVGLPERFTVDDSMIIPPVPPKERKGVEIIRGPNIGEPPAGSPLPKEIRGVVTLKVGDKITTDHIMPAGDKLKYRSNVPRYAEFVFAPIDPQFSRRALENRERGLANLVVGGLSYGQGSSREHAALCPMYLGVRAVLARSFERIHAANLINFGILPLTFAMEADYQAIQQGDEVLIPEVRRRLLAGEELILVDQTRSRQIPLRHTLSDQDVQAVLAGGKLNLLRRKP